GGGAAHTRRRHSTVAAPMIAQQSHERLAHCLPVLLVNFQCAEPLQAAPQRLHMQRMINIADFMAGGGNGDEGIVGGHDQSCMQMDPSNGSSGGGTQSLPCAPYLMMWRGRGAGQVCVKRKRAKVTPIFRPVSGFAVKLQAAPVIGGAGA